MGEYEPRDSRNITLNPDRAPGEPPRTGPREGETRRPQTELDEDGRGVEAEATVGQIEVGQAELRQGGAGQMGAADAEADAALRERAMERDTEELEAPPRSGRND